MGNNAYYEFRSFHVGPGCVRATASHPNGVFILCLTCGVAADLEAISARSDGAHVSILGLGGRPENVIAGGEGS